MTITNIKCYIGLFFLLIIFYSCSIPATYDVIIRNGRVYDGSGDKPFVADIGINSDTIAFIGKLENAQAETDIDVNGLAVAPGFINMLSWAMESLIEDGKSQSDIRQGVTLEIFGEGLSIGSWTEKMKMEVKEHQGDVKFDIEWTTLDEYLEYMVKKGVSTNVASFVGATTLRIHTIGYEDRSATKTELDSMRLLVRQAMEEGALGIGSSLIYAPAFYSSTEELIEICKEAAKYDGLYISHIRSEGNKLLESVDELIRISKESGIRAEIYHLKAAGKSNWYKLDSVILKIEKARAGGLPITADMYNYTAGATALDAAMPPWVQEGGYDKWVERLKDTEIRKKVAVEMKSSANEWENLYHAAGSSENIILTGFKNDSLKPLTGRTLAEVAAMRKKTPEETAMDLVIEDGSAVEAVYFLMSEENVKKQIALPWVSFGSDARSLATEGVFLKSSTHPRAYGNFARLLGKYVHGEKIISLEEAIRKLTTLPATNLKIKKRAAIKSGYYADVVIFDPTKIQDHSTYENPHQYSSGMIHVFVNGVQVLKNGEHTGAMPGQVVRGPWLGKRELVKIPPPIPYADICTLNPSFSSLSLICFSSS